MVYSLGWDLGPRLYLQLRVGGRRGSSLKSLAQIGHRPMIRFRV